MAGARRRTRWAAALAGAALAAWGCHCGGAGAACPPGLSDCGGVCADTSVDPANCRLCGVRCAVGAGCVAGTCQCLVPGQQACGSPPACASLDRDPNCGACDRACGPLGTCGGTPPSCTCPTPALACPGASPECVDPAANGLHCGACGHRCGLGTCSSGACSCDAGAPRCPGASPECVDTQADPANCGACAGACPPGQVCVCAGGETCSAGHCCPSGRTWCGTTCTDTRTDPANCGACAGACPPGQVCDCAGTDICSAGHCCPSSQTWCGSACTDTRTDPANCGACGRACSASQICSGALCACPAAAPLACGTSCCPGTACCSGDTCQLAHPNGLGQSYLECNPLGTPGDPGTYSRQMAEAAALSWSPSGTSSAQVCAAEVCAARSNPGPPADCAVWCYAGSLAGLVGRAQVATISCAAACPVIGGALTAEWR